MTEWRTVTGYPSYEVSSQGEVRRSNTGLILKPQMSKGYFRVNLYKYGRGSMSSKPVHLLVITEFSGPRPLGLVCRHLNGDRLDNRIENLTWGTYVENCADMVLHGTRTRGARIGISKLTEEAVVEIRSLLARGVGKRAIARQFGCSPSNIRWIELGRTWGHVA